MNQQFRELLKPGLIGQLELRNRIVMAPMGTYLAGRDGLITDRLKRYYEERAKGGAALVILGVAAVDYPRGRVMTRQIGISEDRFIPGLAELADIIHHHQAKIGIQLQHGGRIAAPFLSGGHEPIAPSAVPLVPEKLGVARELTLAEIGRLVECFALGALRAKKAGIDGVEIHAGHGYLIDQFLSRSTNYRHDAYGGELKNRARFLLEIIKAAKNLVGPSYPVWCRIDGREFAIENGITEKEAKETASMLAEAGVDAIHVSGYGGSEGVHFTEAPLVNRPGYLIPLARGIKRCVNMPVITAGRISPELGEKALRRGDVDFIAMGRALIADPELPNKIATGTPGEIRKCIYCYSCVHQIFVRNSVLCSINPLAGKENELTVKPAEKAKKILVVGGGPAGMEAAITASSRGHRVIIQEKENRLGGSLLFASIVRSENETLVTYLINRIKKTNTQVILNKPFTPDLIGQIKPDAVIFSVGAVQRSPDIPGINRSNVITGEDLKLILTGRLGKDISRKIGLWQKAILFWIRPLFRSRPGLSAIRTLTRLWMPFGKKVAVLGGGMVGCELAAFLAERGRRVTIVESSDQIAPEMALPMKWLVLDKLNRNNVDILTEAKYEEIKSDGVVINTKDGLKRLVEADTIIMACGLEPNRVLTEGLQEKVPEVFLAGDCLKLSFIKDSIASGFEAGSTI